MVGLIELSGSLYTDCLKIAEYSSCTKLASFIFMYWSFFFFFFHLWLAHFKSEQVIKDFIDARETSSSDITEMRVKHKNEVNNDTSFELENILCCS